MSEFLNAVIIPDKCRRCPFLRQMMWAHEDFVREKSIWLPMAVSICDDNLDARVDRRLSDATGVQTTGVMVGFRQDVAKELDKLDSASQEVVESSWSAINVCIKGAKILEAVDRDSKHILSKCTSLGQIGGDEQQFTDYDILPLDMDWLTESV
jgi:hypothetical protein